MSIINQMLLKLDQRGGHKSGLPEGVRSVAASGKSSRLRLLALLLLAAVGSGGYYGWTWWRERATPPSAAVSVGKMAGGAVQQKAKEAVPVKSKEDRQMAELTQKLLDESDKPVKDEKTARKPQGGKKAKATAGTEEMVNGKGEAGAAEGIPVAADRTTQKLARESRGRIKQLPQEPAMKSITPQQQASFSYQKALSWLQQGRVAEARNGLEEAIRLDSYHLAARQALAGLLVDQKQYHAAENVLQEGLALNPEQYGFAMALARLQVERGEIKGALEVLYRSLPYASDNAGYQAFLAALLQRSEQHKKAIEHYLAALRLAPSGAWQMGLGISLQAENRLAEAQEAFNRAKVSNELSPDLQAFVEQRLRALKQQVR